MAETLTITKGASKAEIYEEILPQISALVAAEEDMTANLANIAAVLNAAFGHLWIGFYIRRGNDLVLGPFQGPLACTRIPVEPTPRGVCGASASQMKTLVVPDVEAFPGHIACSSLSKSEIVVPLVAAGQTKMVLDIDSTSLSTFDETDRDYCEQIMEMIKARHFTD